jgi:hypothetical protein
VSRPDSMAAFLIEAVGARVASSASPSPTTRLLAGLDGIAIVDVQVDSELRGAGLNASFLRAVLLTRLEEAAVPMPKPTDGVVLGAVALALHSLRAPTGEWAVCAALELRQRARLPRDPSIVFEATTWSAKAPALCRAEAIRDTCTLLVQRVATELQTAWRCQGGAVEQSAGADGPRR